MAADPEVAILAALLVADQEVAILVARMVACQEDAILVARTVACPEDAIPMVADPEVAIPPAPVVARKDGIPAARLVAARKIADPGDALRAVVNCLAVANRLDARLHRVGSADVRRPPTGLARAAFPLQTPEPRNLAVGEVDHPRPALEDAAQKTGAPTGVGGPGGRAAGPRGARGPVGGAGRSRSAELGSAPGGVLSPPGRSRRSLAAKRRRFSSRGTLKRSRGSSCVPPGLHDGPRRSSPPRREAARSSSGDSHRRPLANHFSWISACRACSCLKVGRSSSRVCARKDVGFPSRMIVQ
jgi:hypothetical protein